MTLTPEHSGHNKNIQTTVRLMINWINQHWRGRLPAGRALVINVLILTTIMLLLPGFSWLGSWQGTADSWTELTTALVFALTLMLLIPLWQIVGLWRSAEIHIAEKGTILAGRCLQIIATLFTVFMITRALGAVSDLAMMTPIATSTGIYHAELSLSANQRELAVRGGLGLGSASRIEQMLTEHPGIRRIRLEIWGGSFSEAITLSQLIQVRKLQTHTRQLCARECILPYLSGSHRYLQRGARLEFSMARQMPFVLEDELLAMGLAPEFIQRWQKLRGRRWQPTEEVLVQSGIVNTLLGKPNIAGTY